MNVTQEHVCAVFTEVTGTPDHRTKASFPRIDFLAWPRIISADPSDRDIVKHVSCGISWLAGWPSGGVLLAPGLLKFTLVNAERKPHARALAAPLKFSLKL